MTLQQYCKKYFTTLRYLAKVWKIPFETLRKYRHYQNGHEQFVVGRKPSKKRIAQIEKLSEGHITEKDWLPRER